VRKRSSRSTGSRTASGRDDSRDVTRLFALTAAGSLAPRDTAALREALAGGGARRTAIEVYGEDAEKRVYDDRVELVIAR